MKELVPPEEIEKKGIATGLWKDGKVAAPQLVKWKAFSGQVAKPLATIESDDLDKLTSELEPIETAMVNSLKAVLETFVTEVSIEVGG